MFKTFFNIQIIPVLNFFFVFYLQNKPSLIGKLFILFKVLFTCSILLFSLNRELNLFNDSDKQDHIIKLYLDVSLSVLMFLNQTLNMILSILHRRTLGFEIPFNEQVISNAKILFFNAIVIGHIIFDVLITREKILPKLETCLMIYIGQYVLFALFLSIFNFLAIINQRIVQVNEELQQINLSLANENLQYFNSFSMNLLLEKHNMCFELIDTFNTFCGVRILLGVCVISCHILQSIHSLYLESTIGGSVEFFIISKMWICLMYAVRY
jgi:hypothetical protein